MRLVVLDGYTLNPGDLDWRPLQALGDCVIHDRTPPAQVLARAENAEMLLTNKVVLDAPLLAQLPALRYIGLLSTGTNAVALAAAAARGVVVTNVPAYSTPSVAQHTFALLLALTNHVSQHAAAVRAGAWSASPDFCFWQQPLVELQGMTLGLIGGGAIGRSVAIIGQALGLQVLVHTRRRPADLPPGVTWTADRDAVLRAADVLSLHCPLTDETRGLINASSLALMKPTAYLLNTARGPLIDEAALAAALHAGRLAGAALDVLAQEPPPASNPLLAAPNCLITPHLAWGSRAARARLLQVVVANLAAWQRGQPQNVVS